MDVLSLSVSIDTFHALLHVFTRVRCTYSIGVRLAEQGNALYMPYPALVFNDRSERSFISPKWKVVGTANELLINYFITPALYYEFGPAGAIFGISSAALFLNSTISLTHKNYLQCKKIFATQPTENYGERVWNSLSIHPRAYSIFSV